MGTFEYLHEAFYYPVMVKPHFEQMAFQHIESLGPNGKTRAAPICYCLQATTGSFQEIERNIRNPHSFACSRGGVHSVDPITTNQSPPKVLWIPDRGFDGQSRNSHKSSFNKTRRRRCRTKRSLAPVANAPYAANTI